MLSSDMSPANSISAPDPAASPHPRTLPVRASSLRFHISPLLRAPAETRSFIFNTLPTLFNSSIDISPAPSKRYTLFGKNTGGWGIGLSTQNPRILPNANKIYIFRRHPGDGFRIRILNKLFGTDHSRLGLLQRITPATVGSLCGTANPGCGQFCSQLLRRLFFTARRERQHRRYPRSRVAAGNLQ